ncbi:MAG: metal ABC transporter substrate-binding protein [Deinococcaceae bacterium]
MKNRFLVAMLCVTMGFSAQAKNTVLVSIQPYYTIVKNIVGNQMDVVLLLPPGASPHTFDPKPSDLKKMALAKLAFMNGLGLDDWLSSGLINSGSHAKVVRFGDQLKYTPLQSLEEDLPGRDPHIWLDASIMGKAALSVGNALAKLDPQNAKVYQSRALLESQKLEVLHKDLQKTLAPMKNHRMVTFHGAWGYFARAYGLNVVAAIEPFPGKEPSAQYLRDISKTVKKYNISALFAEPTLPKAPIEALADSLGVKVYTLIPEGSAEIQDYHQMMQYNKTVLIKAFKNTP